MQLFAAPFNAMKTGAKTVEIRLNDDKRQRVRVGDLIEFNNRSNQDQKLVTKVVKIDRYESFRDLLNVITPGDDELSKKKWEAAMRGLRELYSEEEEQEYGVVVFHIELISFRDRSF